MTDSPMTEAQALEVLKQLNPELYGRLVSQQPQPAPADTTLPLPHPPIYPARPARRPAQRVPTVRNVTRPGNLAYHMLTNVPENTQHLVSEPK